MKWKKVTGLATFSKKCISSRWSEAIHKCSLWTMHMRNQFWNIRRVPTTQDMLLACLFPEGSWVSYQFRSVGPNGWKLTNCLIAEKWIFTKFNGRHLIVKKCVQEKIVFAVEQQTPKFGEIVPLDRLSVRKLRIFGSLFMVSGRCAGLNPGTREKLEARRKVNGLIDTNGPLPASTGVLSTTTVCKLPFARKSYCDFRKHILSHKLATWAVLPNPVYFRKSDCVSSVCFCGW